MKRAILLFGLVGGLGVPFAFTALGRAVRRLAPDDAAALARLHDVQLPLWPMSKLIIDDPSGKHWLYLPLAAILSNALIYALAGAASAWGRANARAFVVVAAFVVATLFVARLGFGTSLAGFAAAAAAAIVGLALHHFRREPK